MLLNLADLPEVRFLPGSLPPGVDGAALAETQEFDAAVDAAWFDENYEERYLVRPITFSEQALFAPPDGTQVLVVLLDDGAHLRLFLPPRKFEPLLFEEDPNNPAIVISDELARFLRNPPTCHADGDLDPIYGNDRPDLRTACLFTSNCEEASMAARDFQQLPRVRFELGLASVRNDYALNQSLRLDTQDDQNWFHCEPGAPFRIRCATFLEQDAFTIPAGTVVVVAYFSPELFARTFVPPRELDARPTVHSQISEPLGRSFWQWLSPALLLLKSSLRMAR